MSRSGLRRLLTLPVAAAIALIGALACVAFILLQAPPITASVPDLGISGTVGFAIFPARAAILAPVLLAGAASLLAAIDIETSPAGRVGLIVLVAVTTLAILALDAYATAFFALLALLIAVRVRAAESFALAAIPAIAIGLAIADPPPDPLLVLAGAIAAVAAGWRAATTLDLARLARAVALGFTGLGFIAFGLGSDGAARLCLAANALTAPLLAIAAAMIFEATGTRSLDWLGGLARGMPRFSLLLLAGLGFAAPLPPGPGFAAFLAVLRPAIAGNPIGAVSAVALALWFALMGFAAIRAFGLACLGRPRSLRAAAAEDAPRATITAMIVLALSGLVLALFESAENAWICLVLLGLAALIRRFAIVSGPLESAEFGGGFAKPPAWLPFGDPATQITATGFAAAFRTAPCPWTAKLHGAWARLRATIAAR